MATDASFMEFVAGQIENAGVIRYRKMFGEYALYSGDKVVALICENQVFIKPTNEGQAFIGQPTMGCPYPGAKPHFLVGAGIEDVEWFSQILRITERALPCPKPKAPKSPAQAKKKR